MTVDSNPSSEVIKEALKTVQELAKERNDDPANPKVHVPPAWQQMEQEVFGGYRQALGTIYETALPQPDYASRLTAFRQMLAAAPSPPILEGIKITPITIPRSSLAGLTETVIPGDTVAAEWVETVDESEKKGVIVYIHGGAMTIGTAESNRGSTQEMALQGFKVLTVDYRLSPEVQFPSALVDCVNAYNWLLKENGTPASKIIVSGDSAGGNLTIALSYYLRDHGIPLPAGIAPLTPWVDFTFSAPAVKSKNPGFYACMLAKVRPDANGWLQDSVKGYVGDYPNQAKDEKLVNQLLDDVNPEKHLPPILLSTGTVDRLLSETLAFFIKRAQGGEAAHLYVSENGPHDFQIAIGTPASKQFFKAFGQFARDVIDKTPAVSKSTFTFVSAGPKLDYSIQHSLSVQDAKAYLSGLIDLVKEEGPSYDGGSEQIYVKLAA
ncbi:hypothetical protein HDU93_006620 [Gonapodya sp. JEL0774]|nr:hypothetical protein HDU93_006620 [Gonapodya sp. JEL0774]